MCLKEKKIKREKKMKFGGQKQQKICYYIFFIIIISYFILQILFYIHNQSYVWQSTTLASYITPSLRNTCNIPLSSSSSSTSSSSSLSSSSSSENLINLNKKLKIGILVLYGESQNGEWGIDLMKMVLNNRENYAKLHGYEIINGNKLIDKTRPVAWSKIIALKYYLKNYDYLFYIDMDAVIMEPSIKLEDLITIGGINSDFIMTEDWNGLNTGVWFVKNTLWTLQFLDLAWNQSQLVPPRSPIPPHEKHPFEYEQRAFHYLLNTEVWKKRHNLPRYPGHNILGSSKDMLTHITLLPQCSMNSYTLHPIDSFLYYNNRRQNSQVKIYTHIYLFYSVLF